MPPSEEGAPVAAPPGPQRLHLTIAFSDLTDSTRLGNLLEAEAYAELLADLRHLYRDIVPRHGGTIVRIQGDGMLAVFGYPAAREDDGRRATEAALDLHHAVRGLDVRDATGQRLPLSLHSGIHAGVVLLDAGDTERGRFDLVGTVPNLAAHLAGQAVADEILVSAATLGADRHFFDTGPDRTLQLKSHPEPLGAFAILGRAAVATRLEARTRRGATPFVGRDDDICVLKAALSAAGAGQSRCVVLRAPPGLGKTRLAEEFLRQASAEGWQVCRGYCEGYLGAELLQPFRQVLRAVLAPGGASGRPPGGPPEDHPVDRADGEPHAATAAFEAALAPLVAAWPDLSRERATLRYLLGLAADGDARPEALRPASDGSNHRPAPSAAAPASAVSAAPPTPSQVATALGALVTALARCRPTVLFIDDVQWADDVTRQALEAITAIGHERLLLLAATRPESAGTGMAWPAPVVRDLAPLGEAAVTAALARLLPQADPILAGRIRQHAGGNALYLEELCHSAAQDRQLQSLERAPAGGAWLDALVASRVARLAPADREVLRAASVLGNVLPLWLLRALAGPTASEERLAELEQQDFLFGASGEPGTPGAVATQLRFKHGLTRDVIYSAIGLHERRSMHLRAAIALRERGGDAADLVEALAYHYGAGNSPAEAAQFAELAGERALRAGALDRAQQHLRAALLALDPQGDDPAVYPRWMALARRLGMACVFDPSRAHLDLLRRAATLATQRQDAVAAAEAHYWLGYIDYALGDVRAASRTCERALALLPAEANDRLAVQLRATLGQALAAAGRPARAMALFDGALDVQRTHRTGHNPSVGLAYTMACKASVLADQGRFDAAQALFDEALAAVRGAQHQVEVSVLGWRCLAYLWRGQLDEAEATAAAAVRLGEHFRSRYMLAMNQGMAARARWLREPGKESEHALAEATARLEAGDRRLSLSLNHGWLAEAAWQRGDAEAARGHVRQAIRRACAGDAFGLACAWRTLAQCEPAKAPRWLARADAVARWRASPHEAAWNQVVRSRLAAQGGDAAAAHQAAMRAAELFGNLGMALPPAVAGFKGVLA
jgi:class 3 adenylate cyclase/predicted ATPase